MSRNRAANSPHDSDEEEEEVPKVNKRQQKKRQEEDSDDESALSDRRSASEDDRSPNELKPRRRAASEDERSNRSDKLKHVEEDDCDVKAFVPGAPVIRKHKIVTKYTGLQYIADALAVVEKMFSVLTSENIKFRGKDESSRARAREAQSAMHDLTKVIHSANRAMQMCAEGNINGADKSVLAVNLDDYFKFVNKEFKGTFISDCLKHQSKRMVEIARRIFKDIVKQQSMVPDVRGEFNFKKVSSAKTSTFNVRDSNVDFIKAAFAEVIDSKKIKRALIKHLEEKFTEPIGDKSGNRKPIEGIDVKEIIVNYFDAVMEAVENFAVGKYTTSDKYVIQSMFSLMFERIMPEEGVKQSVGEMRYKVTSMIFPRALREMELSSLALSQAIAKECRFPSAKDCVKSEKIDINAIRRRFAVNIMKK